MSQENETLHTTPEAETETAENLISEEEKQEILSVFSETNANKQQKKSHKLTIKNQLILIGCILVVAGILLGCYFLFLKEPEPLDAFYVTGESTTETLEKLDERTTITFCGYPKSEYNAELNADLFRTYTYATLYSMQSGKVSVDIESGGKKCVRISCNKKEKEIPYESFYLARPQDGKIYGFDGENLFTNAIREMTGSEKAEIAIRPLDGFDVDGDSVLVSGAVVMFPMVNKNEISYLSIANSFGDYAIYQSGGKFYFQGCELLSYDEELFASLIVDCRYMVTSGKMDEHLDLSVYGLDTEEHGTCSYTLLTVPDASGESFFHTVRVGKKSASGTYYYAMYFGGKMNKQNEVVETYANGRIYLIPYTNVEENLMHRKEDYFSADLVYGVSKTEDCYELDNIHLDYYYEDAKEDVSILVRNLSTFLFSENASSNNGDNANALKDKVSYSETGLKYSNWLGETDKSYFVGFTSSDAKAFSITAVVNNVASDGKYECRFGMLRDTDNATYAAILPESISIRYSSDGVLFKKASNITFDLESQQEDTVKQYSFTLESEEPILLIELSFTMPKKIGYLVLDEIRVYADGEDAVPNDALSGVWRMVQPASLIPTGKNFSYLDSSNFSDFIYGISSLKGDSVERVGISTRNAAEKTDDILDSEALKEYGLDNPSMHFAYDFNGYTTDLYISKYNEEENCYFAYSTITGDVYGTGKNVCFCTGVIARLSKETAEWLDWDPLEYIDRQLFDIFVYDITELDISYENKKYKFDVTADGTTITSVRNGTQELDERNFRYLYLSIVQLNMKSVYEASDKEKPEEYMRIHIRSKTDDREYVFYRVSSSRAYYTINGEGSYYCLFNSLRNVAKKTDTFVAGGDTKK